MAIKMNEEDVKIHMTITIEKDLKKRFNIACATLGLSMSEAISAMIINFIDISKKSVEAERNRLTDDSVDGPELVFTESSRLNEE